MARTLRCSPLLLKGFDMRSIAAVLLFYALILSPVGAIAAEPQLERVLFNNPGLEVDLGVGLWAWPLPMDYDSDGDLDLVVTCPDKPYNGTYFFENPGGPRLRAQPLKSPPVFKPGVRIADGPRNVQVSYVGGRPVVTTPGKLYVDFREHQYAHPIELPLPVKVAPEFERYRANQWKLLDYDNDGDLDVIIGIGVWDEYGWDDAWDEEGGWTNGPLHGFVYLVENVAEGPESRVQGPAAREGELIALAEGQPWPEFLGPRPVFAPAVQITTTDGAPVDVYGMPSPSFEDFDGDGDLDLVCGEFLDGFTYFANVGSRTTPEFEAGVKLPVTMDLQMITPTAVDWDGDGDYDLVSGDEDGRVALVENKSVSADGVPVFEEPVYLRQAAADVKFGALVTPWSVDWDGDGDEDLICGNTAGYIGFIENLDGGNPPRWAAPVRISRSLPVGGTEGTPQVIRPQAGPKGSIQGPCEAKWGYTTLSVADWNQDKRLDLIVNDIWGKVTWYDGVGAAPATQVGFERAVHLLPGSEPTKPAWTWWTPENNEFATQWRTTPVAVDWNDDGLTDLVMLDHEGYLAYFERSSAADADGERPVLPGKRIFKIEGPCEFDGRHRPMGDQHDGLLRLNARTAGGSGRRKLCIVDWDGDGRRDLIVNSTCVNWLRNVRTDDEGFVWFKDEGLMDSRVLAGHTTSPTTVDWDRNGIPDLLVGAEDGRLYYMRNPRAE